MTDLEQALAGKRVEPGIRAVVLTAAQRHSCQPLQRSRDGHSVPCVPAQDSQVALYALKRRMAIACEPDQSELWAARLDARVERKSPRTHYLHLLAHQLDTPEVAARTVDACVAALQMCSTRRGGARDDAGAPGLRDFGTCPVHGYPYTALGTCPAEDVDED